MLYMEKFWSNQKLCFVSSCLGSCKTSQLTYIPAPAKKIMSLKDPTKKMSKSDTKWDSRILLTDSAEVIKKKINKALTDSIDDKDLEYDPINRPGLANLIDIWFYLQGSKGESIEQAMKWIKSYSKKELKEHVAISINTALAPIRDRYEELMQDSSQQYLEDVAREGAFKASASAKATMKEVREAMGL
jgi:tryptophanyl-tRNA synthetase